MAGYWRRPVWIIPSRGRPHNIRRLIAATVQTCATTQFFLRVDTDDPSLGGYLEIKRPPNWAIVVAGRMGLADIYNQSFEALPDLDWYGVFADDVVPETMGWDSSLIREAGKDGLACGDDPTHFVVGGDLVREMGWLALPGLSRLYIDTVWHEIARERGVFRQLPDVKLVHHHFSNRKALFDKTYRKPGKAEDRAIYQTWRNA